MMDLILEYEIQQYQMVVSYVGSPQIVTMMHCNKKRLLVTKKIGDDKRNLANKNIILMMKINFYRR